MALSHSTNPQIRLKSFLRPWGCNKFLKKKQRFVGSGHVKYLGVHTYGQAAYKYGRAHLKCTQKWKCNLGILTSLYRASCCILILA